MKDLSPIGEARRRSRAREVGARDGITFDVETGELSGSLGRVGAGKTTMQLLSALLGVTPDAAARSSSRRRPTGGRR